MSPFQAILDYELANNIPVGWVNFNIQHNSPDGAWHRLERGEIKLDNEFFRQFNNDFHRHDLWEAFNERNQRNKILGTDSSGHTTAPPLPSFDAECMFWEMMRISSSPDPYMFPALEKLKASGKFVIGALSNTTILPEDHPYSKGATQQARQFFDVFISSAHSGLRKPDPRIYELALKEMNEAASKKGLPEIAPDEIVFLDDIGVNLKWAKKSGLRTVKVNLGRTQEAVKDLEKLTGLQLLDSEQSKL